MVSYYFNNIFNYNNIFNCNNILNCNNIYVFNFSCAHTNRRVGGFIKELLITQSYSLLYKVTPYAYMIFMVTPTSCFILSQNCCY